MKKYTIIVPLLLCALLTGCFCQHKQWISAGDNAPKTCQKCGKSECEVKGHIWTPATLMKPKTCTVCSKTEGDALPVQAVFPEDKSRSDSTKFLFTAEEFPILLNEELKGTGYTVELDKIEEEEVHYSFLNNGTLDSAVSCSISFSGFFTGGENMYLFVNIQTSYDDSSEDFDLYHKIIGAVFRTVHIPAEGVEYQDLIEKAEETEGFMGSVNYNGNYDHIVYSISNIGSLMMFMVNLRS